MKLLFTLLFVLFANAEYKKIYLNDFSADVDIYDMGTMGRGKNAGSWHRSTANKQEVFYYLAMQPWRHLVWTAYEDNMWVKYYINEDASAAPSSRPSTKLSYSNSTQDYCRKEYTTPMATFDIDWSQIDSQSRLESVDINGITCYKYPAKIPLNHIYLREQYTRDRDVSSMTPCRYDFIGGKSITFRSFNSFSEVFIGDTHPNGYLKNKTKCYIDPTPNNVETDVAIVLGIADKSIMQNINGALVALKNLPTMKQAKIYYMGGDSIKSELITNWDNLKKKEVTAGSVDAVINTAKNDLLKRVPKAVYRGTLVVLMDTSLMSSFDAETAFDRNGITVHTVLYNPKEDNQMTMKAKTLLSVGAQHHEFTDATQIESVVSELFVGIRANLTERCNRTKCDGFCDGRDRCTCPMCCENTCYFSYCDTTTATCKPWPPGKPKAKITCKNDCVGDQECKDLEGCVYTRYNDGCEPTAKCMKPICVDDGKGGTKCALESACEQDKKPSFENKCWSYYCDEKSGNCARAKSGNACPRLTSLCDEHVCEEDLTCVAKKKQCVKTSPYIEMECYEARCNRKTGMCENALSCDTYSGCGATADKSRCYCDSTGGKFKCKCNETSAGYCSETQVCDSTQEGKEPHCIDSVCPEDLVIEGCRIKICNEETKENEWIQKDCSTAVVFDYNTTEAAEYCEGKYEIYCDEGDCLGRQKEGEPSAAACGRCNFNSTYTTDDHGVKHYNITYTEKCGEYYPVCDNGKTSTTASKYFKEGQAATCDKINVNGKEQYQCVYKKLTTAETYDYCSGCYSNECYKAKGYVGYTFNSQTGRCQQKVISAKPSCSVCNDNNDGYNTFCDNKKFTQTYTYEYSGKSKPFDYDIPKTCVNEQCIPVKEFNCEDANNEQINAILTQLKRCALNEVVKGEYHYSEKFDFNLYMSGKPQTEEFMNEAEKEAYCSWTFDIASCHYCGIDDTTGLKDVDICAEEQTKLNIPGITVSCVPETNTCKIDDFDCGRENCFLKVPNMESGECDLTTISTCNDTQATIKKRLESWKQSTPNEPEIVCTVKDQCNPTDHSCPIVYDDVKCEEAFNNYMKEENPTDYGCRIPNKVCDESTYHCTFTTMTHPENDTSFFTNRDGVKFGDKCYNYTCVETGSGDNLEHHWVLSEASRTELSIKADHLCETVYCDPVLGYTIHKPKVCTAQEAFKMTEEQAQCFTCTCSYVDGEPQIVMLSSTNEETYELDACGNCIVRDRLTGEQKNKHVECILSATVNLTGAIAGATVAASVVFGLIGAMVVVSIGAFQTYQLVSSAMKNVISTTLENPEFVAADNEATNVLANGD